MSISNILDSIVASLYLTMYFKEDVIGSEYLNYIVEEFNTLNPQIKILCHQKAIVGYSGSLASYLKP